MPDGLALQGSTSDDSATRAGNRAHKRNAAVVVRITPIEVITDELEFEALDRGHDDGGIHALRIGSEDFGRSGELDALGVCWEVREAREDLSVGGNIGIKPMRLISEADLNVLNGQLRRGLAGRDTGDLVEAQEVNPVVDPRIHTQVARQLPVEARRPGDARWIVMGSCERAVARRYALVVEVERIVVQVDAGDVAYALRHRLLFDPRRGIEQPSIDAPGIREIERRV